MKESISIILGIVLFAIVTAILYIIGLKKMMGEEEDLAKKLRNKAALKVLEYIKDHEQVSIEEIDPLIQGIRVKNFYSKKVAVVANNKEFKFHLLEFMIQSGYLTEKDVKGKKVYFLSEKKK